MLDKCLVNTISVTIGLLYPCLLLPSLSSWSVFSLQQKFVDYKHQIMQKKGMNEWMIKWMSEWINAWVNEWMHEWTHEWMNEWMNQSINQSINGYKQRKWRTKESGLISWYTINICLSSFIHTFIYQCNATQWIIL